VERRDSQQAGGMTHDERTARISVLRRQRPRDRFVRISLWSLCALLAGSWWAGQFDFAELLTPRRLANLERFLGELRPYPLQGKPFEAGATLEWMQTLWRQEGAAAARATLAISILAILLAGLWGGLLALAATRSLSNAEAYAPLGRRPRALTRVVWRVPAMLSRGALALMRAVPEYVWAFLLLALFGPTAWPAALALAIHNTGILGRLDAETLENERSRAARALRGIGASRLQVASFALLPAALPRLLLYFFYRWETCVREATVLGMLGVASLGLSIEEARTRGHYDTLLFMVGIGVAIVLLGEVISSLARARLRRAP
jgi:phosphonate transport system permease protein